jgi:hypothetical protein
LSHVEEFGMLRFAEVMSAKAPAAMYFVISVLPSSITSGALLPASDASNFVRWSFQVWYSTLTSTPEWLASNLLLADFTAPSQFCLASSCSQTRSVVACAAWGDAKRAGIAFAAATPSVSETQTAAAATTRTLIEASSQRRRDGRACRQLVNTTCLGAEARTQDRWLSSG